MTAKPPCVYRTSDVWICTVHASVCALVSAKKPVRRHAKSNTCMHPTTTAQDTQTQRPHSYDHTDMLQQLFAMSPHCPELCLSLRMETLLCVNFLILINHSDMDFTSSCDHWLRRSNYFRSIADHICLHKNKSLIPRYKEKVFLEHVYDAVCCVYETKRADSSSCHNNVVKVEK